MGKPADDEIADYGKSEQPSVAEGQTADANTGKKIEIELVSMPEGMKRVLSGGWYLDRYRSALLLDETGALPNNMIYIVNDINEANRRFDVKSETWVLASIPEGK